MQMEDDLTLIETYLSGDEGAIEELVMKYQKQIYSFIYRMVDDVEDAKDLTQKTFVNAINGIRDFRRESSFKTWLYRIAMNTSIKHIQKHRPEEIEIDESIESNQPKTLSIMIEMEERGYIKKSLNDLPERQRLSLALRVYERLSCKETAKVMGCSESAVRTHFHLGIKKLREILRGAYEIKT